MNKYIYIILSLIIFFSSCTDFDQEKKETQITDYPDQESWDAKMYFTTENVHRAIMQAGYIAKYYEKNITLLDQGVKVDFFDEYGEHKSVLTSNKGKVFDDTNNMVAIEDVVVVSDNGRILYTEELHWDNTNQKIISNVDVLITTERDTLYGDSFISDPDLMDYEITNPRGSFESDVSGED